MQTLTVDREALEKNGQRHPKRRRPHAVSVGRPVAGMRIEVVAENGTRRPRAHRRRDPRVRTVARWTATSTTRKRAPRSCRAAGFARAISASWTAGRLFVTGRAKELIIKGGKNLYPYDVERVAGGVDGVRQRRRRRLRSHERRDGDRGSRRGRRDAIAGDATATDIAKAVRAELLEVLGVKPDEIRLCGVGKVPAHHERQDPAARVRAARAPRGARLMRALVIGGTGSSVSTSSTRCSRPAPRSASRAASSRSRCSSAGASRAGRRVARRAREATPRDGGLRRRLPRGGPLPALLARPGATLEQGLRGVAERVRRGAGRVGTVASSTPRPSRHSAGAPSGRRADERDVPETRCRTTASTARSSGRWSARSKPRSGAGSTP